MIPGDVIAPVDDLAVIPVQIEGSRMATIGELHFVKHPVFGQGCVFAERVGDIGDLLDVWFVTDQKLRTMLLAHVTDSDKPDKLSRELRAAFSGYKRAHKTGRARQTAGKPKMKRAFRDRIFKGELRHIDCGDDPAAVDDERDSAAESAA